MPRIPNKRIMRGIPIVRKTQKERHPKSDIALVQQGGQCVREPSVRAPRRFSLVTETASPVVLVGRQVCRRCSSVTSTRMIINKDPTQQANRIKPMR